ncbi:MAG: serine protease [Verrucomicrobia bacterium]|nr:MAG: serine protease [Verrucomicrobiota bacterium]
MKILYAIPAVVLLALAGCVSSRSGSHAMGGSAALARHLVAAHQNSIVTVLGTLKTTMTVKGLGMKQENEAPVEAPATIVDATGWVVAGNLLLDPVSSMFHGPLHIQRGDQSFEIEFKAHLEKLRVLLADKTEVPARVVTQDDDLGLTVLAIEPQAGAKTSAFPALALTGEATPALHAPCLVLSRTGEACQRTPLVVRGLPVNALTKPRACHMFMTEIVPLGLPVFATDGRLIGIGSVDFRPPDLEQLEKISENQVRPLSIILPVADVRDLVARAQKATARVITVAQPPPALTRAAGPTTLGEISGEQARAFIAARQDAIVTLRGSLKYNDGHNAKPHEQNVECVATLVDRAGFAICGNSGKTAELKYEEQHLNFVLHDGTEVPARIVLQDDDLMLTVLAPAPKSGEKIPAWPALALQPNAKAELFDDVLAISRLDRSHHYTLTADTGKITACITQPRVFYLTDGHPGGENPLGVPIFLADGRLLGVTALQPMAMNRRPSRKSMPFDLALQQEQRLHVVPAAALAELVEQARKVAAKTKN